MRKLTLLVILFTISTFAQKDELKTLKRLYDITSAPSEKDIVKYNQAIAVLDGMSNLDENQKNEYNFYKGVQSILDVVSVALKNPTDSEAIYEILDYNKIVNAYNYFDKVKNFEENLGKKSFTSEIDSKISSFLKTYINQKAYSANQKSDYKVSSQYFYLLYKLTSEGLNLENAAILALQAKDNDLALEYYKEFRESDYIENGILYFAVNKENGKEEQFSSELDRKNYIKIGSHEKPRDEKVSDKKPEIYKYIALLTAQSGNIDNSKIEFKAAKKFNPNDMELLLQEAKLYSDPKDKLIYNQLLREMLIVDPDNAIINFNVGYLSLEKDNELVEEINKNLNNSKVYDELMSKRRELYKSALPYFEKAYKVDPNYENNNEILKSTYQILGMPEKADKL